MIIYNQPDAEYRTLYHDHLSISNWRSWMRCGAAQYEKDCGTWSEPYREPAKDPLVIGSFAHTALLTPDLLGTWKEKDGIYKKSGKSAGELYEPFQEALEMVMRVRKADEHGELISGQFEVTATGEIDGVKWCGRIDILQDSKRRFWDFKTTKDFAPIWAGKDGRVAWYESYWTQIALYGELLQQNIPGDTPWIGGIIGATKQEPPAIGAWQMTNQFKLAACIANIIETQRDVIAWRKKSPGQYPPACLDYANCAYCREHSGLEIKEAV